MKWIGLTGGIASGKSTVSAGLKSLGYSVIDADQIAREVVEKGSSGLDTLAQELGADILNEQGELRREYLGEKVFSDPEMKKKLEQILHPLIQAEVKSRKKWLEDQGIEIAIYDVPLLFENKLQQQFDKIVVVYSAETVCLERLMLRNKLSVDQAKHRIKNQIDIEEKRKLADFVVDNSGSVEELNNEIKKLDMYLTSLV